MPENCFVHTNKLKRVFKLPKEQLVLFNIEIKNEILTLFSSALIDYIT